MAIKRGQQNGGGQNGNRGGNNGGQGGEGGEGGDGGDEGGDDISELVNAAVTAQFSRRLPTMMSQAIARAMETALPTIVEQVTTQIAAAQGGQQGQGGAPGGQGQQGQQGQGGAGAAGGQQQGGVQADPEVAKLRKQLDDVNKRLAQQAEQAQAQEAEARNARRDAMLTDHLTKLGVDKHRLRGAMAIARDAMVWDGEAQTPTGGKGAWVWRAQRNGYTEDLTIEAGLGEWGKTDEGKSYIAAQPQLRGVVGSGGHQTHQRQQGGGGNGGRVDPAQQRAANAAANADKLFTQVSEMLGGGTVTLGGGGGG